MDNDPEEQAYVCDNTDEGVLETLIGNMTDIDFNGETVLQDETEGFRASESPDGETGAHGTLKEYEDQLIGLRKDNFNLKLRIYFLEERLQTSSAPKSHDELYKSNLELKVKVGSLSRELKEHKNLLRSAAEAMEFTEQTAANKEAELNRNIMDLKVALEQSQAHQFGGASVEDSVALYTEAFNLNKLAQPKIQVNDKTLETTASSRTEEKYDDKKSSEINNAEIDKLQNENTKLYKLMQGCLERINRMDKTESKQRESLLRREERIASLQRELNQVTQEMQESSKMQSYDVNVECEKVENKFKDLLVEKNKRITVLENELNKLHMMNAQGDGAHACGTENMNVQEMLTKRLREMAYFLDSLISHRCVIGEEKQRKIENLLEESLRLPIDLELDPEASRLLENSYLDNTFNNQSINILDLTRLLKHHVSLEDQQDESARSNRKEKISQDLDNLSHRTSQRDDCKMYQQKLSGVMQEKEELLKQLNEAKSQNATLENNLESLGHKYDAMLSTYQKQIEQLHADIEMNLNEVEVIKESSKKEIEKLQEEVSKLEQDKNELIQSNSLEMNKIEMQHKELEMQMEAILHQKREMEKQCMEIELRKSEIEVQLVEIEQLKEVIARQEEENKRLEENMVGYIREDEERVAADGEEISPSPDQGIDSDRHSSLEIPDSYSAQDEILSLRLQLRETEKKLEAALRKLTPLQERHHRVERAICKQIHKTTAVLREAKKNFNA